MRTLNLILPVTFDPANVHDDEDVVLAVSRLIKTAAATFSVLEAYGEVVLGEAVPVGASVAVEPNPSEEVLARIGQAYLDNQLDADARRFWGKNRENENRTPPEEVILYSGRGGKTLLTLADCLNALNRRK